MVLGLGLVQAQIPNEKVLDKTWKVNLMLNTSHEFVVATKQKIYINNDNMIVVPQCYRWDYYFKIVSVTDERLVLEEYEYTPKKLTPTGNHVFFTKSDLTGADLEKLDYKQKPHYLRINS